MMSVIYYGKSYRFLEVGEVIMKGDLIDLEDGTNFEDACLFVGETVSENMSDIIRPNHGESKL